MKAFLLTKKLFKNHFIKLICIILIIYFATSNKRIKQKSSYNVDDKAHSLLNLFHEKNIFLIDVEKLKDLALFKNSSNLQIDFQNFFNSSTGFSLGVFFEDLEAFQQEVCIWNNHFV